MFSPPTHPHSSSNGEQRSVQHQAEAFLCVRCTWPLHVCPCRVNTTSRLDVDRRHREAVARAEASGWAEHTRLINLLPPRRWAA